MAIKYFGGIDGKKYILVGGIIYRAIVNSNPFDPFRDNVFTTLEDIRRIEEIDWGKIEELTDLYKKLYKTVKWNKNKSNFVMTPKAESLGREIWNKFSIEHHNLFPGSSPKGFLLNLQYVKNRKHWNLLWQLVKSLKIFSGEWERFVKYRWGEISGEKIRIDLRNKIVWQVIKKLKRKRAKVRDMVDPINAKIDKEKKFGIPGKRAFYHITESILRQIIHKRKKRGVTDPEKVADAAYWKAVKEYRERMSKLEKILMS